MSTTGDTGERAGTSLWLHQCKLNARATIATLLRTPRRQVFWPSHLQLALGALAAVAVVVGCMLLLDGWSLANIRRLPASLTQAFDRLTHYGKSGWILWPTGLVLIALALSDSPTQPRFQRQVLAAWSVRLGFVFTAVALPGVFVTTLKRLIGRARPFVEGNDVWAYMPFVWRVEYASLPSGHATTAFSALVAIGAILPQARALLWIYAVMIALSRVVVGAHHPSDVVAGAIAGAAGALLVRHWFAARRLGFWVGPGGAVHPMPGPNLRRIVKAVARRLQSA